MYTILHIHCAKEITDFTQKTVIPLGRNIQIISCHSISRAKEALALATVNCIIADLKKNANDTILFLQKWQESIDYCRNAIILLADDETVVLNVLTHIHFCEVFFNESTEKNKEMIAAVLKRHYSLYQQLYHPLHASYLEETICIKTTLGNKNIQIIDILFIEACKHRCIIHTIEEGFIISKPLCKMQEYSLFSKFKQSHRSFLINSFNILQINTAVCPWVIAFKNCNKQAYVSRSFQKSFEEKLFYKS